MDRRYQPGTVVGLERITASLSLSFRATTVLGYLPQELLGTSCYEYFHQEDLRPLAETHRKVLRSKEKIETSCYKFKTKLGSFVMLQSQWFSFINPWTKEIEFIVSTNRVL